MNEDQGVSFDVLATELTNTITSSAQHFNEAMMEVQNPIELMSLMAEYGLFVAELNAQIVGVVIESTQVMDEGELH